jgi:hypothetical protein
MQCMDSTTATIVFILDVLLFGALIAWVGYKLLAAKPEEEKMDPDALADELGLPRKVTPAYLQSLPSRTAGRGPAVIIGLLAGVVILFLLGIIFGLV